MLLALHVRAQGKNACMLSRWPLCLNNAMQSDFVLCRLPLLPLFQQYRPSTPAPSCFSGIPTQIELITFCSLSTNTASSMSDQYADTNVVSWKCTKCGRRYVDSSPTSLFIVPPPTTSCSETQTKKTWTQASGDRVLPYFTSGATCDFVRMQHTMSGIDLGKQVAEQYDGASTVNVPLLSKFFTRPCDGASAKASMKAAGEHGRVSRQSGAVDSEWNKTDVEECDFWNAECNDVDCIYQGEHCRYQCAMAEVDEEPKPKVSALKRGLRLR